MFGHKLKLWEILLCPNDDCRWKKRINANVNVNAGIKSQFCGQKGVELFLSILFQYTIKLQCIMLSYSLSYFVPVVEKDYITLEMKI